MKLVSLLTNVLKKILGLIGLLILLLAKIGFRNLFREIMFYQYEDQFSRATSFNATTIKLINHLQ